MKKEFKTTILLNHRSAGNLSFKLDEMHKISDYTGLTNYQIVTMLIFLVAEKPTYVERFKAVVSLEKGSKQELEFDINLFLDQKIEKK